jgi:alpha-ribazole phosphatase
VRARRPARAGRGPVVVTAIAPARELELWAWRHPRALGAAGRCIGRTDLAVDRRKARRLAGRIRAAARRHGLPREIWTSPLQRAADVGKVLRAWGWTHRIDARLVELDFGRWDGRPWREIDPVEVAAWEADFVHHAPGGGESLAALRERVAGFVDERSADSSQRGAAVLVVSHAGWMSAAAPGRACVDAAHWPAPTPTMGLRRMHLVTHAAAASL